MDGVGAVGEGAQPKAAWWDGLDGVGTVGTREAEGWREDGLDGVGAVGEGGRRLPGGRMGWMESVP